MNTSIENNMPTIINEYGFTLHAWLGFCLLVLVFPILHARVLFSEPRFPPKFITYIIEWFKLLCVQQRLEPDFFFYSQFIFF